MRQTVVHIVTYGKQQVCKENAVQYSEILVICEFHKVNYELFCT